MNRITRAFNGQKTLVAFITGGDPNIETTEKLIPAIAEAGADIIEIGIPFSDPVAEGPIIQMADERALLNGCTTDKLFDMLKRVRRKTEVPLLFMTYLNPVFTYGKEKFFKRCEECGIDGIIVPDMPFEEKDELYETCKRHNIVLISMIAPTSKERIAKIAKEAEGFLYCVSSLGVTGVRDSITTDIGEMIHRVKEVSALPCAVGFGVSDAGQARDIARFSDGVIVGSAIVSLVEKHGDECLAPISEFVSNIKKAIET